MGVGREENSGSRVGEECQGVEIGKVCGSPEQESGLLLLLLLLCLCLCSCFGFCFSRFQVPALVPSSLDVFTLLHSLPINPHLFLSFPFPFVPQISVLETYLAL